LIYSYWNDDSALAAGLIKKQFPAIKFVSRAHGWDFYFYRNLYGYLPFKWFIYNSLDCFYLISFQAKNYLQTNWKIKNTQKVKLARLGVFPIPNKSFINTQTFTIVSVASLIPLKRINLIVEALALIRNVELKWIHFGDGPMFDVIQQKAKNLFSNQIHFEMRGHISQQALYHFYQSESVQMFINVSQYEGLPVSIMEAFAAAIPAIATDVGAVSEIVNEENGFLLNVDFEPKELADIILKCCSQPQLLKSKSTYALATWKQYYNAEVNYKLFADSLLSL
jgi:glycosyltransferase involved in cell wall biosynthesis